MPKVKKNCGKCGKTFESNQDLNRHLNKKYPCDQAQFKCNKCDAKLWTLDSKRLHEKACKGPEKSEADIFRERIVELEQELEKIQNPEQPLNLVKSIGIGNLSDAIRPQVYFGIPGELLIPETATDNIIIKFGSTTDPSTRIPKHDKDFGGFNLLDCVVSNNPSFVESKLKEWLKVNRKLIRGKTENKKTTDTELFEVSNQEDYEKIVRLAKVYSDEYQKDVENKMDREQELSKKMREMEIESLKMRIELMSVGS